jgi:preprotein translocase subunit SecG
MSIIFLILVIIASVLLALIVLVQNPKGGGLSGNIAGFSNQFMGVKQTTDVLEKGTWILAAVITVLCLFSAVLVKENSGTDDKLIRSINPNATSTMPVQPQAPAPAPSAAPAPAPAPAPSK